MKEVTLVLTLRVVYEPNGENVEILKDRLSEMVGNAAGNGMLTGNGPAEVSTWHHMVKEET